MNNEWSALAAAALCAGGLMPFLIGARALGSEQASGPQRLHLQPTSRLGGAAVYCAYFAVIVIAALLTPLALRSVMLPLAAMPVVFVGIWEDVSGCLSPRHRLLAAFVSAALASTLAGGTIARLDVPYLDDWLTLSIVVLPITWFMVIGACNAINLIDGAHGLAGGTALILFAGLAIAAAQVQDALVLIETLIMFGGVAGFLVWNYPRGLVFLGDGGAYFIGFMYAQLSIQLVARNDHVSAWFVIMLAAYPIVETLFSIYRRKIVTRQPSMEPDALHLHSLLYHRVTLPREQSRDSVDHGRANARVAPRLWLHGAVCCGLALAFRDSTVYLIASLISYAAFYLAQYRLLTRFPVAAVDPDGEDAA